MATAEYTIRVKNESSETQNYLFFNQEPQPSSDIGQLFTNVWIKSPGVPPPRGSATLDIKIDNFAVCGITPKPVDYGAVCSTSDYAPVELTTLQKEGTEPVMDIVDNGPQFVQPYKEINTEGSFGINTGPFDGDRYNTVYVGFGKYNDRGDVVPVAVWRAEPSQSYILTPTLTYFVSTGEFKPGEAVDIKELGAVAKIDFTLARPGQTIATVVHQNDGSYSDPTFDYPEKKRHKPHA